MRTPVIVTFANQKGGVGKTTLCIAFANYLFSKGVRVTVIDADFQHSIVKRRNADIKEYGGNQIPYEVISAVTKNDNEMASMIEKLYNDPSMEVVLIDSAGTLTAPGLPTLLINSDVLVLAEGSTIQDIEGATEDGKYILIPFEKVDAGNVAQYQ